MEGETTHGRLVLTRRVGDRIRLIAHEPLAVPIWIEIVDIALGKVRLRIEAPSSVEILRAELLEVKSDDIEPE